MQRGDLWDSTKRNPIRISFHNNTQPLRPCFKGDCVIKTENFPVRVDAKRHLCIDDRFFACYEVDTAFADVFAGKSERKDRENPRFGNALGDTERKMVGGGIGIRGKPETATFIREIHGGREKRFSECQSCLIIERQSHRGKTRRNQLFQCCSEIDEFSGMDQIQNLFQLRMVCAMADSRIKSDTGAYAKGSLVLSGDYTSDLDREYAVWITGSRSRLRPRTKSLPEPVGIQPRVTYL